MTAKIRELLGYRELVENLVIRDLKVRYKNSILGFLWSLVNPLLLMLVFTVVFTVMLPNVVIPRFPVFVLCALLPWNFFNTSLVGAVHSITQSGHLIKKVYFPREILPISVVFSNLANFLLALPVLLILVLVLGGQWTPLLVWVPVVLAVQVCFTVGVAFILATLNVFYRDTSVILEVIMQAWFFLTPVFYPVDLLPEWKAVLGLMLPVRRLVYIFNPMASIIATFRSIIYGFTNGSPPAPPAWDFFTRTAVTSVLVLVVGYWFLTRYSHRFGEEV